MYFIRALNVCNGSIPVLARQSCSRMRSRVHRIRELSEGYLPNSSPSSAARAWAATRAFSNSAFMSEASIDVMAA